MLIYCVNLKYGDGEMVTELLLEQKSRNQNYDADLTVCSRNDAKTYSTRAPQGASLFT